MTVADRNMEHFIRAVNATESPKYYLPEEIIPAMYGRKIRIEGGPLSGYEGSLLTTRGSKVKRLLVELEGFLAVGVEVAPEYIQLIRQNCLWLSFPIFPLLLYLKRSILFRQPYVVS